MTELEVLRIKVAAYDAAAGKFLDKVRDGRAKSVETYRELLAAWLLPSDAPKHKLIPTGDASRHVLVSERLKLRSEP